MSFVGATTAISTRLPYLPVTGLLPLFPLSCVTLATTTDGSSPALATIARSGAPRACSRMRMPASPMGVGALQILDMQPLASTPHRRRNLRSGEMRRTLLGWIGTATHSRSGQDVYPNTEMVMKSTPVPIR